jgi:hypothetical protein
MEKEGQKGKVANTDNADENKLRASWIPVW